MTPREHPLFKQYPLTGEVTTSSGTLPTPYHIYDGQGMLIAGTASLDAVTELLSTEQCVPVTTTDGRAFMALWVFDFTDASLGAHMELQHSLFVSYKPIAPVKPHRFALLKLLALNPDVKMLCHGIWNTTESVVAYNSEHLGLDAKLASGNLHANGNSVHFSFNELDSNNMLLNGTANKQSRTSPGTLFSIMGLFGLSGTRKLMSQPYLTATVINRISEAHPQHKEASTFVKNKREVIQPYDGSRDRVTFGNTVYSKLGFEPDFIEHMGGFKFVYLDPV